MIPIKKPFKILALALILTTVILFGRFSYKKVESITYPQHYSQYIDYYSAQYNVTPSLVYAVVKCESNFNPNAVSEIGAKGLMQITDDTLDWAMQLNNDTSTPNPFDPETNIKYGTFLLSHHIKEFSSEEIALAAYHAGRGAVNTWLSSPQYSSDGETLHTIPYDDTRAYVKRVLKVQDKYEKLYY